MNHQKILERYKEEFCSRCNATCDKGIVVFTEEKVNNGDINYILTAKCVDHP